MKRGIILKTLVISLTMALLFSFTAFAAQTTGTIYQGNGMHFYQIVSTGYQDLTWTQARDAAAALSAYTPPGTTLTLTPHLVTINSQREQSFLETLPGTNTWLWIGLYQSSTGSEPDGGWAWVTGEDLTYTNWADGEPNNTNNGEEYGEWNSGKWNDNNNTGRANGYIVEYESSTPVPGVDICGVEGVHIDEIADLRLFQHEMNTGYPVDVTGYIGFLSDLNPAGNPTNPKLTSVKLEVEKNASGNWMLIDFNDDFAYPSEVLSGRCNLPGREFPAFAPWVVNSAGTYVLKVTATFTTGPSLTITATESVTVSLSDPVVEDKPAAPAVAARILKEAGIAHRYDTGFKDGKNRPIYSNYISDVAKMMGSSYNDKTGTGFMGIDKADTANYYRAVYEYLIELGADLK